MPVSTTGRPAAVLSILVTANTRQASASLAAIDRQMAYSVKRAQMGSVALSRAATAFRFAGVAAAAGIAGSVAAAIKFESSFANVRKTVQATEPEFKRLQDGFLQLSTEIPESASSLAELGGAAGALGIKEKDLLKFTKTASMLGTTTQLSSEMAADGLARVANVMDLNVGESIKRMGDILIKLGNKGASTEGEILEMSKRIAATGKQIGMNEGEVMGFAAALANLGIKAELGGSAISRVMRAMQTAIAEGPSAELDLFAKTAGMTTQEFAKNFKKDVPGTIGEFSAGLAKINKAGGSAQSVLVDLGKAAHTSLGEIRVTQTLLGLASNTDELARTQRLANQQYEGGNALAKEAQKRYETLAAQMTLLKNSAMKMGIEWGTTLIPTIKETVELLQNPDLTIDEKVAGVMDGVGKIIEQAAPTIAKAGGVLGVALIKGLWEGFKGADLLGKIFIGGIFLRTIFGPQVISMIAGSAVMSRVGTAMAAPIMGAFQSALQFGIGSSIASFQRGAAGATGFASAAGKGGIMAKLGPMLANGLAFSMANAIPLAIGAAGIANILFDVIGGDMEGAAWEAGGGLAGALVGGLAGGLPGAMIGLGLGTVLGDLLGDMDKGPEMSQLERFSERIGESASAASASVRDLATNHREAVRDVRQARRRDERSADRLKEAEQHLAEVRRKYPENSRPVIKAEHRVSAAKRDSIDASRDLERAERAPAFQRKHIAEELERAIGPQQAHVDVLKKEERQLWKEYRALKKSHASWEERDSAFDAAMAKGEEVGEAQGEVNKTIRQADKLVGPKFAKKIKKTADEYGRLSGKLDRLAEREEELNDIKMGGFGAKAPLAAQDLADNLAEVNEKSGRTQNKLDSLVNLGLKPFRDSTKDAKDETTKFGDKTTETTRRSEDQWRDLSDVQTEAIDSIAGSTNKALGALGVARVDFGVGSPQKKRKGGSVVPGHGSGDKVLTGALTEPGEGLFVLNKNAMGAYQAWNSMFPRRQGGGAGLQPAASALAAKMVNQFGGSIGSGYRAGDDGFHGSGQAIDWSGGNWGGGSKYANALGPSLLEGIYNPALFGGSPVSWDTGARVASSFWGGDWAGHQDHIHMALSELGKIKGGAMAAAQKLKRILITGPAGAMRSTAQGSADKVWKAANKYLSRKTPAMVSHGNIGVDAGGSWSKPELVKLWKQANPGLGNPNLMAAIALAESSGNPRAVSYAGARGLWQIMPFHGGGDRLFEPAFNAMKAGEVFASQGLGAWDVYTGKGGGGQSYLQYMRRGGAALPTLDKGGQVTRRGVAEVHPGDVHRGKPSIEIHLHGPGMDKLVDEVYAIVDGERVEVENHGRQRSRMRRGVHA